MNNLQSHYALVRARLMRPPNAVRDTAPAPVLKIEPPAKDNAYSKIAETPPPPPPRERPANCHDSMLMPRNLVRGMIKAAAEKYGISAAEISGSCRRAHIVLARHEVMYRAVEAGFSLGEVGRRIGGYDHTTVLNGHRKFKAMLKAGEVTL